MGENEITGTAEAGTGPDALATALDEVFGGGGIKVLTLGGTRTEVPVKEDGTPDYSKLPHMDLDKVPADATEEEHIEFLQAVAGIPEDLILVLLYDMGMDLIFGHGVDPETAQLAITDFVHRCRDRYPDALAANAAKWAEARADAEKDQEQGEQETEPETA